MSDDIQLIAEPGRCPFCATHVAPKGEDVVQCPRCRTPYHRDCYAENRGCGVYGCEAQAVPLVPPEQAAPPARRKGPDEKFCSECAAVIKAKAVICPHCGCPQGGYAYPVPHGGAAYPAPYSGDEVSRGMAAVLAIFLGGFGAHKFYMGRNGIGLMYLFMSVTGVTFFIGFIEGLVYLLQSDETFRRENFPRR